MGYSITANRDKTHYGIKTFLIDEIKDLKTLPTCRPGSKAYCSGNGVTYIKDSQGYWRIKQGVASGGGSASFPDEVIFDGNGSDSSDDSENFDPSNYHFIWDGGVEPAAQQDPEEP